MRGRMRKKVRDAMGLVRNYTMRARDKWSLGPAVKRGKVTGLPGVEQEKVCSCGEDCELP